MLSIRHWVQCNNSGMHHVAKAMAEAESRLGHDSAIVNIDNSLGWDEAMQADIHVSHTHFPQDIKARITKPYRVVWVGHGTPEHVFDITIENFAAPGYGQCDGWQMLRTQLREADAVVTFWHRHQALYQTLVPKERPIHLIPLGVDLEFWAGGADGGKYAGAPSVWTSENQHRIKWVLDTLIAWSWVTGATPLEGLTPVPLARLHAHYIPWPNHRFFIDLANSNGAAYRAYLSASHFAHESLRDMWRRFDFFWSPVRYGDHNTLSMQAAAVARVTGLKVISYRGNRYADYWVTEGDQREMAKELCAIFRGEVTPRADKLPPPDLADMGRAMIALYESLGL